MLNMKKNILKLTAIFGFTAVLLNSCGPKDNPPLVYFPDMYFPVAYDPLQKAEDAYSSHDNVFLLSLNKTEQRDFHRLTEQYRRM